MHLPFVPHHLQTGRSNSNNKSFPDFILLAEFCEQVGPTTLLTIPQQKYGFESFDFDGFARRILSSDHTRKVDPSGCNSGWMSPEDTMVYLKDSAQNVHAYVHHLTIHDIEARGYVRPLCLCYVTQEEQKIMQNFDKFMDCFTQLANLMKYGNNCVFLSDINDNMSKVSHDAFQPDVPSDIFPAVMEDLRQFKDCFLANIQKLPPISSSSSSGTEEENMEQHHGSQQLQQQHRRVPNYMDGDFTLDEELVEAIMVNTLSSEGQSLPPDFSLLLERGLNDTSGLLSTYIPLILKKIHKQSGYDKKLRDFDELVKPLYRTIMTLGYHSLNHFSRPFHVLDRELDDLGQCYSCAEDVLFIGGVYVLEFGFRSNFNMSSSGTSFSQFPHFTPNPVPRFMMNDSPPPTSSLMSYPNSCRSSPTSDVHSDDSGIHNIGADSDNWTFNSSRFLTPQSYNFYSHPSPSNFETFHSFTSNYSNNSSHNSPPMLLHYKGQGSYISQLFSTQNQSVQVLNPNLQKTKSLLTEKLNDQTPRNSRSSTSFGKPAIRLLINHYSFAKDLVYAVLIGIPVIIYAADNNVRYVSNFVSTLKSFVPGLRPHDTTTVIPWRTTPLSILDLSKVKVVGLSKKVNLTHSLEAFVCKLDFEEQTLVGPLYTGESLDKIFNKHWPDERTVVSYVHSQFLDWGSKAAMYYQLDCIGSIRSYFSPQTPRTSSIATIKTEPTNQSSTLSHWTNQLLRPVRQKRKKKKKITADALHSPAPGNISIPTLPQQKEYVSMQSSSISLYDLERITSNSKAILNSLGVVKRCDMAIIEYLAEIVKQQQKTVLESLSDNAPKYTLKLPVQEKVKMQNAK